jgi:hypothetical protein
MHGSPKTDPRGFVRDPNVSSDQCYHPTKCPPRRSRLAKSELNAQKSAIKEHEQRLEQLNIPVPASLYYAVLTVYQEAGVDVRVHAIAASIWDKSEKIAEVPPIHCEGMTPALMHDYMRRLLKVLHDQFGIRKFAAKVRLDPQCCPIRPCFLHEMKL